MLHALLSLVPKRYIVLAAVITAGLLGMGGIYTMYRVERAKRIQAEAALAHERGETERLRELLRRADMLYDMCEDSSKRIGQTCAEQLSALRESCNRALRQLSARPEPPKQVGQSECREDELSRQLNCLLGSRPGC